jgi:outer membrane protein, heavy metal efflux system
MCSSFFYSGRILSMFRSFIIVTIFIMTAGIFVGHAQSFTLEEAVAHALKANPDLAAARCSIDEARGRLLQSGQLSNPELESELKPNVRGREFSVGIGFVQRFPLTNRLQLEKQVSEAELAAAQAEVKAAEWQVASMVRQLGIKLLSLEQSRALKNQQITNSKKIAQSAADLAKRAEGSETEAAQFELEAQQLAIDLLMIDSEKATLSGELRPWLGITTEREIEITGALPEISLPASAMLEVTQRDDFQAAQARIAAARQHVALARANQWDDATIGLAAEVERAEDAPDGLETDGFIGLKFSLPLPWWHKNEGKIKEAEATVQRTEKEADALAMKAQAEATAALAEMKAAARLVAQTTETLLPKAQEIEDKLNRFYQQAQPGATLADVLRAREKRLSLEQARLDALRTYHLARIRFTAAQGRSFIDTPSFLKK